MAGVNPNVIAVAWLAFLLVGCETKPTPTPPQAAIVYPTPPPVASAAHESVEVTPLPPTPVPPVSVPSATSYEPGPIRPPVRQEEQKRQLPDFEIARLIVQASRGGYSGSCACPDNVDRAGRRCGDRSAYSRPGGRAPICFTSDVTPAMIESYRRRAI
jgi:hypothetical protein